MNKTHDQLKNCLHPYLFALKEGKKIHQDFFDYSLMLIQVHATEIIRDPNYYQKRQKPH